MRKLLLCFAVIVALMVLGGRATAVPVYFGDGGASLQKELNNITIAPIPGKSSIDVTKDALSDDTDSTWAIHGSGASVETVIVEVAQWAGVNTFGVYDATNPANMVEIFQGTASTGSQALLSILADGSVVVNFMDTGVDFAGNAFGYYLDSTEADSLWTGGLWYSNTSLNIDQKDHMYAYQGKGIDTIQILPFSPGLWASEEYVLAFEDLHYKHWGNQDGDLDPGEWSDSEPDFSDFVVIVESVEPIPEPSILLLLGSLFLVLIGLNRKKFIV